MNIQYYISALAFILFAACVAGKTAMLRRKGVKAIVFGATDKMDFLLVPPVLLVVYSVFANAFSWPIWKPLAVPFWRTVVPGWIGLILCVAAVCGIVASLISFGDSFRVGIDEKKPDKLVTGGMFAISRNPIYVCFDTFFLGQFLVHRNILTAVFVVVFALLINRQILREEEFLKPHYGAEYEEYCRRVRRYL
ncbi:MAG: isoprenylcysteine carboxylmethyltransferase family protein [Clostridiales bacterium]|jgi:protein-S-isoprenylcysteine O-methyltransferase Ste14|nr:isoprenylcysteine carboxylmethyltransferase family protein [Clostridiales bacterium]